MVTELQVIVALIIGVGTILMWILRKMYQAIRIWLSIGEQLSSVETRFIALHDDVTELKGRVSSVEQAIILRGFRRRVW